MVKTRVIETAAIKAGYAVKKGSAEKGVVVATTDSENIGILKGNSITEEFAVGAHAGVALVGEVCLAILGQTVTAGQNLSSASDGRMNVMGSSLITQRIAVALDSGFPSEAIEVVVTNDQYNVEA